MLVTYKRRQNTYLKILVLVEQCKSKGNLSFD